MRSDRRQTSKANNRGRSHRLELHEAYRRAALAEVGRKAYLRASIGCGPYPSGGRPALRDYQQSAAAPT
jgi:hypothetical protein